jgi:TIR domain
MPNPSISDTTEKLSVFVSYSRKDMAAADRLVEALEANGFAVSIDRRDLPLPASRRKTAAMVI